MPKTIYSPEESENFLIANGQANSAPVAIGNPTSLGLLVPTLTNATLKVQVSQDGITFFDLKDTAGTTLLTWAASTGGFALSSNDLAPVLGYPFLRLVSGVNQGADRAFTLLRKCHRNDPMV